MTIANNGTADLVYNVRYEANLSGINIATTLDHSSTFISELQDRGANITVLSSSNISLPILNNYSLLILDDELFNLTNSRRNQIRTWVSNGNNLFLEGDVISVGQANRINH